MKNDITRFDVGIFNSISFTSDNTKEHSETTSNTVIKEPKSLLHAVVCRIIHQLGYQNIQPTAILLFLVQLIGGYLC